MILLLVFFLFGCANKSSAKLQINVPHGTPLVSSNFNESTGLEQSWFVPVADSGSVFEAKFKENSQLSFVADGTITQVVQNGPITVIIQSLDFSDQTVTYHALIQNPSSAFSFKGMHVTKGVIFGVSTGGSIRRFMNLSVYDSNLILSVVDGKGVAQDFSGVFPLVK